MHGTGIGYQMVKKPHSDQELKSLKAQDDADRRKHLRVDMPLKARFLNAQGIEQACYVTNISAGGAFVRAKVPPPFGASVVLYIDQMGRFEGKVIRSTEKSFAVTYERKRKKSSRTADDLTQVLNRGKRSHDRRQEPRIRHDAPALIYFDDGRTEDCAILDISLTGASIEVSPRPPLGANLILGRMTAKVVRRHETGVGVVFTGEAERMDEVIEETTQDTSHIETPAPVGASIAKPFGKKG